MIQKIKLYKKIIHKWNYIKMKWYKKWNDIKIIWYKYNIKMKWYKNEMI